MAPGAEGCFLFDFYIKPQQAFEPYTFRRSCFLFDFYIKPQPVLGVRFTFAVVSYSISTSNHNKKKALPLQQKVVSYSISTSNHNTDAMSGQPLTVVSYSISTSNHNISQRMSELDLLFLIRFLHQTTTTWWCCGLSLRCFLFDFYIKPQPGEVYSWQMWGCFLFDFYIKPQPVGSGGAAAARCFLFDFYIKPQLGVERCKWRWRCFLFDFYIKPQHLERSQVY